MEGFLIEFIKPIHKARSQVDWQVEERTKAIVKYYAEYTGLNENDVVDIFLLNILNDAAFKNWINNKRRNTRILKQLYPNGECDVASNE